MASRARTPRTGDLIVEGLGWLALLSTLALLSPGVSTSASAEPPAEAPVAEGATCSNAAASNDALARQLERYIAALQARAAQQPSRADDSGVVVLNTRGYGYPQAPAPASPSE